MEKTKEIYEIHIPRFYMPTIEKASKETGMDVNELLGKAIRMSITINTTFKDTVDIIKTSKMGKLNLDTCHPSGP